MDRQPRAPRYLVSLPVRYRLAGDGEWRSGVTENVSRSGLLFNASGTIVPDAAIELSMCLTPGAAEVQCSGRVVRASTDSGPAWIAALIEEYRFEAPAVGRS